VDHNFVLQEKAIFLLKIAKIAKKWIITLCFKKKVLIFLPKMVKIAKILDHNIGLKEKSLIFAEKWRKSPKSGS
jgi:hypothetical protein